MAFPLSTVALAAVLLAPVPAPDLAQRAWPVSSDCSDAAEKVVEKTGGQLLSVQPSGDKCIVTVLVQGDGQRPRKITLKVPM